jgi:endonuclease-3
MYVFSKHMQPSSHSPRFFRQIFAYLQKLFPISQIELNYTTPFQLLVAVILSAQTTDKQVNKVTEQLFQHVRGPQDVIDMGFEKLTRALSAVNFYRNKA